VYAPGVDLDVDPLGELMPGKRELPAGARALREAAEAAEGGEAYTSGEGDGEPGATVADVEVDVRETTPSAPWEVGA
jgi:hypothetical protein